MLSPQDVEFVQAVADSLESTVIANATQRRWRAGDGSSVYEWSTLRTFMPGEAEPYHLGTGIEKHNQRAMLAGQPDVLATVVAVLRGVDTSTPDSVAAPLLTLSWQYNKAMRLRVDDSSVNATAAV